MPRPPFKRNRTAHHTPGRLAHRRKDALRRRQGRGLRLLAFLLLAFTALQYLNDGQVTWPRALLDSLRDKPGGDSALTDVAGGIEQAGRSREGATPPEFDISGRVVRVADGDTLSVLDGRRHQHKVRLFGIDTPERDQPHGRASAEALAELVAERTVGVVVVETDSYDRQVGTVYLDRTNINVAMVASGNAWWYRYYAPHERALETAEREARKAGLGLWADPDPVPPWDWRRGRRNDSR